MSESASHRRLVNSLVSWITDRLLKGESGCVFIDDGCNQEGKPPKIYGYVPDVYVPYLARGKLIIGEAKTLYDLERKHTIKQLEAFLQKCDESENSFLILAVPWDLARNANAIINKVKQDCGIEKVKTEVIEKLAG